MIGRQTPTFEVVGDYSMSDGKEAVELFESYGFGFDEAQRHQMELYLAKSEDGKFAAKSIGGSVPRQNGKSYAARWYAVWCAAICGMKVVYSAHNGETVAEFFELLTNIFEDDEAYPDFAELLDGHPYRQPGRERISFTSGGRIRFMTRTNNKSRGGTCSVLVIDEAQELTDPQLNAMLPTTSASKTKDRQTIYIGTPPDPSCAGTVFRRIHDKAHSDDPGRDWWYEWAVEDLPSKGAGEDELLALAYETNPTLGERITEAAILDEISKMTIDGFARERLGWWDKDATAIEHVVKASDWDKRKTDAPPKDGVLSCAVKFAPDGSEGAIAVCLKPDGGTPHVEVAQARSLSHGIGWARDWLLARRDKLALAVIDGLSAAAALTTELEREKYPKPGYAMAKSADVVAACSMFADAVKAGELTHFGQPDLDAAVTCCGKRRIGNSGGFGFESNDNGDATLAEAAALAYWAAMTTKRRPGRKLRVG